MNKQKPKILITSAYFKLKEEDKVGFHAIRETYAQKIIKHGGIPIFIPSINNENLVEEYLKLANGILIPGGNDINPKLYNSKKSKFTEIKEEERDYFEYTLIQKSIEKKIPILGICRGCQMLGIASGGSLYQHIPNINQNKIQHMVDKEKGYNELFEDRNYHEIKIDKNSKIYSLIKTDNIKVNTAHHQAIKKLGSNFRIVARSNDNIVEIIEHTDKNYFCFGFQFHIEAMANQESEKVFKEFIKASKAYKNK